MLVFMPRHFSYSSYIAPFGFRARGKICGYIRCAFLSLCPNHHYHFSSSSIRDVAKTFLFFPRHIQSLKKLIKIAPPLGLNTHSGYWFCWLRFSQFYQLQQRGFPPPARIFLCATPPQIFLFKKKRWEILYLRSFSYGIAVFLFFPVVYFSARFFSWLRVERVGGKFRLVLNRSFYEK